MTASQFTSLSHQSIPTQYATYANEIEPDHYQLLLTVDGIHCAACIARIEKTIRAINGVTSVRLNFSTRRLNVKWHGAPSLANDMGKKLSEMGYHPHAFYEQTVGNNDRSEEKFLLFCLGLSGFATGNIMLLSLAVWITDPVTMGVAMRDFLHWMSALIAIPSVAIAGQPFFRSAFYALSHRRTNMDVPISVGLILTIGVSLFELVNHGVHAYFDSAVMLMFFLLIGRYLDVKVRARARGAATELLQLMNQTATILENDLPRQISIKSITNNMMLMVSMGERIPADGIIITGISDIDLSMATGETVPVRVQPGDTVISGTLNMSAPLIIRSTRDSEHSFLADVIRLMEIAEQGQAHYTRLADRAARLYTPVVHVLALASFLGWVFLGGIGFEPALLIAATVLIITCPCALGLAVPVVQIITVSRLMKQGILIKSGDALERLSRIDTVVFDKTGTLTQGEPSYTPSPNHTDDDLKWAASLAIHSKHPLSRAISRAYSGTIIPLNVTEEPGNGLWADTPTGIIRLGHSTFCGIDTKNSMTEDKTSNILSLWMTRSNHAPREFCFFDKPRINMTETLKSLKKENLSIHILSGDTEMRTATLANNIGIPFFKGNCTPKDKYDYIQNLSAQGYKVLMVGDGLNDAPVLSAAYVSMSPSSAMDITQTASDIVFTGPTLAPVYQVYNIARRSNLLIMENFALAILYNAIAIPIAMAGYVTPLIAALAMSGSSILVILNSFRLNTLKEKI